MIRERVNVFGHVRPMEPKEQLEVLQIPPGEIGLIKEAPVKRWATGQELWDKKFRRTALKVAMKRKHYEDKAARLLKNAREQGLELKHETRPGPSRSKSTASINPKHDLEHERRWGTSLHEFLLRLC